MNSVRIQRDVDFPFYPQSPDNPTPYATTMLLAGSGSDNCKHSHSSHDPCSSGTSSPHSDPQFKNGMHGVGGPYPPHGGECLKSG